MAGYIGNSPTPVPLTSADLADSIITSAKIVDGTITTADLLLIQMHHLEISSSMGI
jgi:hypothetical protein